jgi:hypothetical protein
MNWLIELGAFACIRKGASLSRQAPRATRHAQMGTRAGSTNRAGMTLRPCA